MEDQPSPAYRIFHDLWLAEVPEMYCYGMDYIAEAGMPTTGDRQLDKAMSSIPRRRYMTVAAMVLFHEEGAPITLVTPADSIPIYQMLQEHMKNWQYIVNNFMNCNPPPAEELYMLDEFARAVHPLSLCYNDGSTPATGVERAMKTIRGKHSSLMMTMGRKRRGENERHDVPQNQDQTHQSVADDIARRMWGG